MAESNVSGQEAFQQTAANINNQVVESANKAIQPEPAEAPVEEPVEEPAPEESTNAVHEAAPQDTLEDTQEPFPTGGMSKANPWQRRNAVLASGAKYPEIRTLDRQQLYSYEKARDTEGFKEIQERLYNQRTGLNTATQMEEKLNALLTADTETPLGMLLLNESYKGPEYEILRKEAMKSPEFHKLLVEAQKNSEFKKDTYDTVLDKVADQLQRDWATAFTFSNARITIGAGLMAVGSQDPKEWARAGTAAVGGIGGATVGAKAGAAAGSIAGAPGAFIGGAVGAAGGYAAGTIAASKAMDYLLGKTEIREIDDAKKDTWEKFKNKEITVDQAVEAYEDIDKKYKEYLKNQPADNKLQTIGKTMIEMAMKDQANAMNAIGPELSEEEEGSIVRRATSAGSSVAEYMMDGLAVNKFARLGLSSAAKLAKNERFKTPAMERLVNRKAGTVAAATTEAVITADIVGTAEKEAIDNYIKQTGDEDLTNYKGSAEGFMQSLGSAIAENIIEKMPGGVLNIAKNPKNALRFVNAFGANLTEEASQSEIEEAMAYSKGLKTLQDVIDSQKDNFIDAALAGISGAAANATIHSYMHAKNVEALTKEIAPYMAGKSTQEISKVAEGIVDQQEQEIAVNIMRELATQNGLTDTNSPQMEQLRNTVKAVIDSQIEKTQGTEDGSKFAEMTEKDLAATVDGWSKLIASQAIVQAALKGTPVQEYISDVKAVENTLMLSGFNSIEEAQEANRAANKQLMDEKKAEINRAKAEAAIQKEIARAEAAVKKAEEKKNREAEKAAKKELEDAKKAEAALRKEQLRSEYNREVQLMRDAEKAAKQKEQEQKAYNILKINRADIAELRDELVRISETPEQKELIRNTVKDSEIRSAAKKLINKIDFNNLRTINQAVETTKPKTMYESVKKTGISAEVVEKLGIAGELKQMFSKKGEYNRIVRKDGKITNLEEFVVAYKQPEGQQYTGTVNDFLETLQRDIVNKDVYETADLDNVERWKMSTSGQQHVLKAIQDAEAMNNARAEALLDALGIDTSTMTTDEINQKAAEEAKKDDQAAQEEMTPEELAEYMKALDELEPDDWSFMIAGPMATKAPLTSLMSAKKMESNDIDPITIFRVTGWYQGPDGKWRFEISDKEADVQTSKATDNIKNLYNNIAKGIYDTEDKDIFGTITDKDKAKTYNKYRNAASVLEHNPTYNGIREAVRIIDSISPDKEKNVTYIDIKDLLNHEKLYENYPTIGKLKVALSTKLLPIETRGQVKTMGNKALIILNVDRIGTEQEFKATLMHELQHVVQIVENFASGGNPSYMAKKYPTRPATKEEEKLIKERNKMLKEMAKMFGWPKQLGDIISIQTAIDAINDESYRDVLGDEYCDRFIEVNKKLHDYDKQLAASLYKRLYGEAEARNTARRAETDLYGTFPESTFDIDANEAIVLQEDTGRLYQEKKGRRYAAYDNTAKAITLGKNADAAAIPHEMAHHFLNENFNAIRTGFVNPELAKRWRAVEEELGIKETDTKIVKSNRDPRTGRLSPTERFARMYERFAAEEQIPLQMLDTMVDFRNLVADHYDAELDDVVGLQDENGMPIKITPAVKDWFRGAYYSSQTMGTNEKRIIQARLGDEDEQTELQVKINDKAEAERTDAAVEVASEKAPKTSEIMKTNGITPEIMTTQRKIGGGETKESKGKIGQAIGKEYESTSWIIQQQLVDEYLKNKTIDEALDELDSATYPDNIDANFLREALVDKMIDADREDEAAHLVEETAEDLTNAAQRLQAARHLNSTFSNFIDLLTIRKAEKLAKAKYGKIKPIEKLDKAINDIVDKYEGKFIQAKTDEERSAVMAALVEEAQHSIGSLNKAQKDNELSFQADDVKEVLKALRREQNRRASVPMYRARAKRMLKDALGISPTKTQVREIKKRAAEVNKAIKKYRSDVRSGSEDAFDPEHVFKAMNAMNNYMDSQTAPGITSKMAQGANSYMMSNMLWNTSTNVFNMWSTWVQMIPHMLATRINYGSGTMPLNVKKDIIKNALKIQAKTGYNIFGLRDFMNEKTIMAEKFYEPKSVIMKVQQMPLMGLGLMDTMNKGVVFLNHVDAMATKQAKDEGLKGQEMKNRAKELFFQALNLDAKTITMDGLRIRKEAITEGEEATFTQSSRTAKLSNQIRNIMNLGYKVGAGNVLIPFTTTVANLAEDAIVNYGFGTVKNMIRHPKQFIKAINPTLDKALRQEAWKEVQPETKNILKNAMAVAALVLTAITVGDEDDYVLAYGQQTDIDKDLRENNNAPYETSVRIGDKWYSLELFGIGMLPAKMYLIAKRGKLEPTAWVKAAWSITDTIPGVADLLDLDQEIRNKLRYNKNDAAEVAQIYFGEQVTDIATRLIPAAALINQIGNITDTTKRAAWEGGFWSKLAAKIPVLRERLPEKLSKATGKPIPQTDDIFNLVTGSRVKDYIQTEEDRTRRYLIESGIKTDRSIGNTVLKKLGKGTKEYKQAQREVQEMFIQLAAVETVTEAYINADPDYKKTLMNRLYKRVVNEVAKNHNIALEKNKKTNNNRKKNSKKAAQ